IRDFHVTGVQTCALPISDRNTEYLFYQTLVGAWPIDVQRMSAYLEKAIREAKVHTSWTRQNEEYERDVGDFVLAVMEDEVFCTKIGRASGRERVWIEHVV